MSSSDEETTKKLTPRDLFAIVGAIVAVLIAGTVIFNGCMADTPRIVGPIPQNGAGQSAKAIEMRQEQEMMKGQQAPVGGSGGGGIGDDIDPTKLKK